MDNDVEKIKEFFEFAKDLKNMLERAEWSELDDAGLQEIDAGSHGARMDIRDYLAGFTGELLGRKVGEFCRKYNYYEGKNGVDVLGEDGGEEYLLFESDGSAAGDLFADISREINRYDTDFWFIGDGFGWGYRCGAKLGVF